MLTKISIQKSNRTKITKPHNSFRILHFSTGFGPTNKCVPKGFTEVPKDFARVKVLKSVFHKPQRILYPKRPWPRPRFLKGLTHIGDCKEELQYYGEKAR